MLVAVYLGVYELIGFLLGLVDESVRGQESTASFVFFTVALPIIVTSVLLIAFAASAGWLRELFARHTLTGRRWMWIVVDEVEHDILRDNVPFGSPGASASEINQACLTAFWTSPKRMMVCPEHVGRRSTARLRSPSRRLPWPRPCR